MKFKQAIKNKLIEEARSFVEEEAETIGTVRELVEKKVKKLKTFKKKDVHDFLNVDEDEDEVNPIFEWLSDEDELSDNPTASEEDMVFQIKDLIFIEIEKIIEAAQEKAISVAVYEIRKLADSPLSANIIKKLKKQ